MVCSIPKSSCYSNVLGFSDAGAKSFGYGSGLRRPPMALFPLFLDFCTLIYSSLVAGPKHEFLVGLRMLHSRF